jgi:menaquinone-dependent protoporphyrinogen oxidase
LRGNILQNIILVTYASRTGSTKEVAEKIGEILAGEDSEVETLSMQQVKGLERYQAVVAGSAIQNRQWLPEAMDFVRDNQVELSQYPFAMFSLCMTLAMRNGENFRPQVSEWITPVRRLVPPISERIFAGTLDISKIPNFVDRLKFHLSVTFGVWSEGDHRDWEAINSWAQSLRSHLVPAARTPE